MNIYYKHRNELQKNKLIILYSKIYRILLDNLNTYIHYLFYIRIMDHFDN